MYAESQHIFVQILSLRAMKMKIRILMFCKYLIQANIMLTMSGSRDGKTKK